MKKFILTSLGILALIPFKSVIVAMIGVRTGWFHLSTETVAKYLAGIISIGGPIGLLVYMVLVTSIKKHL